MTQIQFTLNMDKLKDSIMNSNIEAVTKSTIVLILNEYMEKERDEYLNNKPYERGTGSRDYRNGYYTRSLMLEVGKV
ncbi:Transposase, Mutator family, partial [Lentibacillus persicus]